MCKSYTFYSSKIGSYFVSIVPMFFLIYIKLMYINFCNEEIRHAPGCARNPESRYTSVPSVMLIVAVQLYRLICKYIH